MPVVVVSLCQWWLWICCRYEFGSGFVPIVVVGVVVVVEAMVVVDDRCYDCDGCDVIVKKLIYYLNVL